MMPDFEPYYAVIFTSKRSSDQKGYDEMNDLTFELVEKQKGYLGAERYYNDDGYHVSIIMFKTQADIVEWKLNPVHKQAQKLGKERWYDYYNVKVCKVEREYEFNR